MNGSRRRGLKWIFSLNELVVGIGVAHGYRLSNGLTIHGLKRPCTCVAILSGWVELEMSSKESPLAYQWETQGEKER